MSNSKYQPSHCCHIIFPWLCIWGACTIIFCQWLYVDPGKDWVLFPLLLCSLCCALCRLVWKHWTYEIIVGYILPRVPLSLSPFVSFTQHIGLYCFISPVVSFDDDEKFCASSYYHHGIGNINQTHLFKDLSWNIRMCCMSCYGRL